MMDRLSPDRAKQIHMIIRKLPLFQGLTLKESQVVLRYMSVERFRADETIYKCGDPTDRIYILIEGTARLLSGDGHLLYREKAVSLIGESDFMAHQISRPATLKAETPALFISILTHYLQRYLYVSHSLALKLYRNATSTLIHKLDTTNARFIGLLEDVKSGDLSVETLFSKWEVEPMDIIQLQETEEDWLNQLAGTIDAGHRPASFRKKPLNCLGFIFYLFAHYTDGHLSTEEEWAIWDNIGNLGQGIDDDELEAIKGETLAWLELVVGGDQTRIKEELAGAALWLKENEWFDDEICEQVLTDMVDIARQDDNFHQQERNWIAILSEIWEADFTIEE